MFTSCQDHARLKMSKKVDFLVKDSLLYHQFLMDIDGVSTYASQEDKEKGKVECKIYYTELEAFANLFKEKDTKELLEVYLAKKKGMFAPELLRPSGDDGVITSSEQPLEGVRIAIDPAFIGGSKKMASLEGKLLKVLHESDTLWIDEGQINLMTALVLSIRLQKLGAEVKMTRTKPGYTVYQKTFFRWLQEDFRASLQVDVAKRNLTHAEADFLRQTADTEYIFKKYFKPKSLRTRIEALNRFKPHLTIGIGYNLDENNWNRRGRGDLLTPTTANYSLIYVPGSFLEGELEEPRQRMEFLRLLTTKDYENSVLFAKLLSEQLTYQLNIPPVANAKEFDYLLNNSTYISQGVYARNLSLTGMIHSPVCYVAPLCLDNLQEVDVITAKEIKAKGLVTSKRVVAVADAIASAISAYFNPPETPTPVPEM